MNSGLIIGGLMPAIIFGFTGILAKLASERGISTPVSVFWIGIGFIIPAPLAYPIFKSYDWNLAQHLFRL